MIFLILFALLLVIAFIGYMATSKIKLFIAIALLAFVALMLGAPGVLDMIIGDLW